MKYLFLVNSIESLRTTKFNQSLFIRSLLVVMSLLYVFSPLHSKFSILLHSISHQMLIENHHVEKFQEEHHHSTEHNHHFLASNHSEESENHHEKEEIQKHSHELISFFNAVFNNDVSKENKEKPTFENKIDKHILSNSIDSPPSVLVYKGKNLWGYYSLAESLELDVRFPPPQSSPA